MANIQFKHVYKQYDKVMAIDDAHFEILDREFMVLVGPSGCGKSTLLRMIAGLEEISGGDLLIDGKRVNDLPPRDRDIAIVFQNYALYPHMTAYENLAFGLKIRGMDKAEIHKKVIEAARILEIESLLDRKPKAMSGGQRQRVAIGRAMVRNPRVFLFDEPLSNLDAKLRGQMRLEIARLHQRLQSTVLYVTHDQVEAMTLGDRIAVISQGKIQQIDTPQNLYNAPRNLFVAGFIGSPPMNFIHGHIYLQGGKPFFEAEDRQFQCPVGAFPVLETHAGRPLTVGVRPEHLHIHAERGGDASAIIRAEVQLVERLGHESFVFARFGNNAQLVARIDPGVAVDPGVNIELYCDTRQVQCFDAETGEAFPRML
jgi:multiple sugar transport system ATP-binding protein